MPQDTLVSQNTKILIANTYDDNLTNNDNQENYVNQTSTVNFQDSSIEIPITSSTFTTSSPKRSRSLTRSNSKASYLSISPKQNSTEITLQSSSTPKIWINSLIKPTTNYSSLMTESVSSCNNIYSLNSTLNSKITYFTSNSLLLPKILSAVFYAVSSCAITIVNKEVLTNYNFPAPDIIALGQLICIIFCLLFGKYALNCLTFPNFTRKVFYRMFPLPIFYAVNLFGGLLSTKALSLPMFTCLRRVSILLTLILESVILKKSHNIYIKISVMIMLFGAFIAAVDDLSFNLLGYVYITVNNIATAANGVYTKKKLDNKKLGKYGILCYNAIFTLPIAYIICQKSDSFQITLNYANWSDPLFITFFTLSCIMGLVLNFSLVLCTHYNSALVSTVVGTLKNIVVAYYGVIFPTIDYKFSWINFWGVTVSVIGSLLFSWYTFRTK